MAIFTDDSPVGAPARRRSRWVGWTLLAGALLGSFGFAMVPAPYVIEQPGPVFNTLGTVIFDHKQVPLIEIPGEKTYPTTGALDMLTVNVVGDRQQSPSWFEVAQAWLDRSKAVLPLDSIYPVGETVKQSNEQATVDMQNSQKDAIAAALTRLGYTLPSTLSVAGFSPDSPSKGRLQNGDTILSVNGTKTDSVLGLRAIIAKSGAGVPLTIAIARGGQTKSVEVTPQLSAGPRPAPIIGIFPAVSYTYPFTVKIQLQDVGGPSAGQMFALGIIDKLTPGSITGGAKVAGTGTIDADGNVGAIGGIRQKLYGAKNAGATWFLAPYSNCNEVTGHIPSGLRVLAVKTLDDSLAALKAISTGASTKSLLACPAG
ncbi:YlbL family protein [Lacisediminihabitans profunda]|uniref:endopeptidase La n=1 Tax=Lacisediminihabitans profunda TaxID=2594790 RepID=A0A5C8URL8_9MICO|nr:S16 family serine protease [Lacisediminihabitans profunda]TXN31231.1 PDZ domain-containing protein [Lacisediminihabitans profunda]